MNIKGSLPLLILHRLSRGPSHGYRIVKEIRRQSDGLLDFADGTLYPTLHALQENGLVESYEQEENGRTRRYYRLTEAGATALAAEKTEWQRFTQAVNLILGEAT